MEKIISIAEHSEYVGAGYAITTDKQVVKLLIDDNQQCCESSGYFFTEDKIEDFIGAYLVNVSITDTLLNTKKLDEIESDETSTMFVNIETSKGLLQFVAYNTHNGYYGHSACVSSTQLKHEETL